MKENTKTHVYKKFWDKGGINSAAFWSRWLTWGEGNIFQNIRDIERKFKVKISYDKPAV